MHKKREVLFFISVMIFVSSLLFIIGNNVPVLASYRWFWAPIFIAFSLMFFPKIFLQKNVYSVLIYGFLYVGVLQYSLWIYAADAYKTSIFNDFYALIVMVSLFTILIKHNYYKEWKILAKLGLWFIIITGLMTIIATNLNPIAIRAGYSEIRFEINNFEFLYKLGFGTYGYISAIVVLFPILIYFAKNPAGWLSRNFAVFLMVYFFLILLQAQVMANIIIASLIIILSFLGSNKFKRNIFVIILLLILIKKIPESFWINLLSDFSERFERGSLMHLKIMDIIRFIKLDDPTISATNRATGVQLRAARYPMLKEAFLNSPFLGDASYKSDYAYEMRVGKHLYWMSRFALWGVFGFLGYIIILKNVFKPVIKLFDSQFKFYYLLSLLSIISLGFFKNLALRETYLVLLIIIPGLYYSQKIDVNKNN